MLNSLMELKAQIRFPRPFCDQAMLCQFVWIVHDYLVQMMLVQVVECFVT